MIDILTKSTDFIVNLYQSIIIVYFLIQCLGIDYSKTSKKNAYMVGVCAQMIYLITVNYITSFENFAILIPVLILIVFAHYALEGHFMIKLLWCISIMLIVMMSSLAAGIMIGTISHQNYVDLVSENSVYYYIAAFFAQLILFFMVHITVTFKKSLGSLHRTKEIIINITIPVVSILTVSSIIEITGAKHVIWQNVWFCLAVAGIILIDILSYVMLGIVQKQFKKELEYAFVKASYENENKNIEEIRALYLEASKIRHDLKNYVNTTKDLLNDEKYEMAKQYLEQFEDEKVNVINKTVYTQNPVLDLIINRKFAICNKQGIGTRCFINGAVHSISDVDISILMGNLLDNAIEAAVTSIEKNISIEIYAQDSNLEILVMNSVHEGAFDKNPDMKSTKSDNQLHGFGIMNINEVVAKYKGSIDYKQKPGNNILCKVMLNIQ